MDPLKRIPSTFSVARPARFGGDDDPDELLLTPAAKRAASMRRLKERLTPAVPSVSSAARGNLKRCESSESSASSGSHGSAKLPAQSRRPTLPPSVDVTVVENSGKQERRHIVPSSGAVAVEEDDRKPERRPTFPPSGDVAVEENSGKQERRHIVPPSGNVAVKENSGKPEKRQIVPLSGDVAVEEDGKKPKRRYSHPPFGNVAVEEDGGKLEKRHTVHQFPPIGKVETTVGLAARCRNVGQESGAGGAADRLGPGRMEVRGRIGGKKKRDGADLEALYVDADLTDIGVDTLTPNHRGLAVKVAAAVAACAVAGILLWVAVGRNV
eukprot:CAMPEP_0194320776 /NCGR_PEP_ID=MMETSP0171-20130528/17047_1 /TAXON_ID=218684 /ORGANISM="Corethron pennatum, Strain L29A3" /LENGTH=324 /DNA_ID=CAMNT_0039078427 /DNA_START=77 /DNA_END=1051 /DNA_ORIENTATION=-